MCPKNSYCYYAECICYPGFIKDDNECIEGTCHDVNYYSTLMNDQCIQSALPKSGWAGMGVNYNISFIIYSKKVSGK